MRTLAKREIPATAAPGLEPAYLGLHRTGELKPRGEQLWEHMSPCRLCPRECGTDRLAGNLGVCGASSQLQIASFHPHFGEEAPLVGRGGSGTIFFAHCNLRCAFCMNWDISHEGHGGSCDIDDLGSMMLDLQDRGCHNINLVTPTHYSAHVLLALERAAARGLRLPLVYNTSGWELPEILAMLDGVVDIYLPDLKYADAEVAATYSPDARSYPEVARAAILEMHRQVGIAWPGDDGLVRRGLMIRHLVMPHDVSATRQTMEWIAAHLPPETYVNVMSQYVPAYRATEYPAIARRLTRTEYAQALEWAREAGLTRVDVQGY